MTAPPDPAKIPAMPAPANKQNSETLIRLREAWLTPLPQGALWWAEQKLLVVSDLHLEKGSSFARRGQMLPPYDTRATLACVEALCADLKPTRVISLGDSFHDRSAELRLCEEDAARIRALTGKTDWLWVEGNHDPDPPESLGGRAAKVWREDGLVFRHEPTGEAGEVFGHLHPAAKVKGRGRSIRRRCFVTNGETLAMPALGAFTGGLNVLDEAFRPCFPNGFSAFVMGGDTIYTVHRRNLLSDGPVKSNWRL